MAKNTNAFTGVDQFYYKMEDDVDVNEVERIQYLQEIEVEREEEITQAFGDNTVAELAKSAGATTLTASFHKIDLTDKAKLFNLTEDDGLFFVGQSATKYAAVMFARTTETGTEYVGLFKGVFLFSNMEGATKEDEIEFQSEESEAQFMPVEVEGIDGKQSFVLGYDENGSTVNRDRIYQLVFGVAHPDATPVVPEG